MSQVRRIFSALPLATQLVGYNRTVLRKDLTAGLTVGVILVPQGMAYALVAGLPPVYGLYTALVPLIVYSLLGTSRQLSVGPTALASLLTASAIIPLAGGDVEKLIGLALLLAFMTGVVQLGLGFVRAGFLANFLSRPVLAGFTSAAALIIGLGQLKHVLGTNVARSDRISRIVLDTFESLPQTHLPTLIVGASAILVIAILRWWKPTFPAPLVVLALGTVAAWWFGLASQGVAIVGAVPAGIPRPQIPSGSIEEIRRLVPGMLTILAIGIIETIAVAKHYASRNRYEIDTNRELVALGAAKFFGSFFGAFPNTGGFSRTAVNADSGAKTQVATLVSAGVVALALLFLTPLFRYLPNAVLGAIIITAVASLVDVRELRYLWKVDRQDFALLALTFVSTAGFGIETGILAGIISSLAVVLHASSRPHTAVMGRLPGTETFRNIERYPEAITEQGVVILRVDASLFFANTGYFKSRISEIVEEDPSLRLLVLDLYPVNRIDSTALHALRDQVSQLQESGIVLLIAGAKGPIRDRLQRAGIVDDVGHDCFFFEVSEAVRSATARLEQSTPLQTGGEALQSA